MQTPCPPSLENGRPEVTLRAPGKVYVAAMARRMPNTHGPTEIEHLRERVVRNSRRMLRAVRTSVSMKRMDCLNDWQQPRRRDPAHGDRILERAKVSKVRVLDEVVAGRELEHGRYKSPRPDEFGTASDNRHRHGQSREGVPRTTVTRPAKDYASVAGRQRNRTVPSGCGTKPPTT